MSQMTPIDLFLRDLCEMDPADPADERTVCVSLEQLRALLENRLADERPGAPFCTGIAPPGFVPVPLRARLTSMAFDLRRLMDEEDPHLIVSLLGPERALLFANFSLELDAALKG